MAVVSAVDVLPMTGGTLSGPARIVSIDTPLWDRGTVPWLLNTIAVLGLSLGLWAVCLNLFQRHNDFPAFYHPDEPTKGEQIVSDSRNFNHPQLMLEGALLLMPKGRLETGDDMQSSERFGPPFGGDIQRVVREGRKTSAAFAAGAAVLMAWAGWAAAGWVGFLAVGLAVGLCPALLSHAHYFKEDAALVFGIAVVLCAGAWSLRVRDAGPKVWTLIALGIGSGLAASGKYCGLIMVIPAVLVSVAAVRRHASLWLAAPLIVIAFTVATWAGVNYRAFHDFDRFLQNFNYETDHGISDHHGLTMAKPNWYFADLVWTEAMPHVKVLVFAVPVLLLWQIWKRRRWGFGLWLALTTAIYLAMLGFSVIPFYRYALPVTVMLYAMAALGVAWLSMLPPRAWMRWVLAVIGLATIGVTQGYRCADFSQQFADDSRDALRDWAATGLPAGAAVMVDNYATPFLGDSAARIVQVLSDSSPARGKPEDMRQRGVQFVITCSTSADRFISPHVIGVRGMESEVTNMRAFYHALESYPVVWQRVARHPMWIFNNPDIRVYRLDPPKS